MHTYSIGSLGFSILAWLLLNCSMLVIASPITTNGTHRKVLDNKKDSNSNDVEIIVERDTAGVSLLPAPNQINNNVSGVTKAVNDLVSVGINTVPQ